MYCERFPLWRSISNLRYPTRHNPRSSSLPNCLTNVQYRMYADDRYLTFASINEAHLERALNEDLAKVNEWLIANNLTLNKSKTEFMLIRSRHWRLQTFNTPPSLFIDNAPIQVVSTKSLDVYVDENVLWNVHIANIAKKIASGIGILKRSWPFVTLILKCSQLYIAP